MDFTVVVTDQRHQIFAETICFMMDEAAQKRGTGIAKRDPDYIRRKIISGSAVIALHVNEVVGFCYIESWEGERYVANSGLIVHSDYRQFGLATKIKTAIFELSKIKFPQAKLFGITTSPAVMKINSALGYQPVSFSELTTDDKFWDGCKGCKNYDILKSKSKKMCLCTGMLCDLSKISSPEIRRRDLVSIAEAMF